MANLTDTGSVERFLGITLTDAQATQATLLLPAADAAIARYTERAWLSAPIVGEVYTPDGPILALRQRPIVSVEQVAAGWYLAPPVALTAGSQYSIRDAGRGLLLLTPWWASRPNDRPYATVAVSYTPASTVPEDVALAATMLVANWLQPALAGDGNDTAPGAVAEEQIADVRVRYATATSVAPAGTLPPAVVALLAPYRAALAFA